MSFPNATPPQSPSTELSSLSVSIVVHRLDEPELRRNLITLRLAADRLPKPCVRLTLIDNSLNLLNLSHFTIMMVKGGVILAAAVLDAVRNRMALA